jgi:hypothetical protein
VAPDTFCLQFAELLDISIRFGPSGALVSKKVCVAASLGVDSFEKASCRVVGVACCVQHVALVCARFKTLEKELDALRTFPGVSVFAHAQEARETATAPVQAQPVVDLSVAGAMSGAAYSIRLYLPAS